MKAKLIREIPQREGLPYYFKTYEYECIECGQRYTRKRCDDRINPYCSICARKHDKEKQKEQRAKREQRIVNAVLDEIKADIELARYGLVNDGLDLALMIIDRHMKGGSE